MSSIGRVLGRSLVASLAFHMVAATAAVGAPPQLEYRELLPRYTLPLHVTQAPGTSDLFIVEQGGMIKRASSPDGETWAKVGPYLDLKSRVIDPTGQGDDEQGLLGLAFHPNYAGNGLLYVYYTRRQETQVQAVIAEYRRKAYYAADPASARVVLVIDMPDLKPNHTGGHLVFGPDGLLYIGVGDGGGKGDPSDRGQDTSTLLAKILRIDPRDPDGDGPASYSIPRDNPFVGRSGRDEIWIYGTRQPWRFSFDRRTGDLWIGDVGEAQREEVDRERANDSGVNAGRGRNLGWSRCEGSLTFKPVAGRRCELGRRPVYEYGHSAGWCSVTGGYVYRGPVTAWHGLYIAADWCGGRFVLDRDGDVRLRSTTEHHITSFGEGPGGRLFATGDGKLFMVVPTGDRP